MVVFCLSVLLFAGLHTSTQPYPHWPLGVWLKGGVTTACRSPPAWRVPGLLWALVQRRTSSLMTASHGEEQAVSTGDSISVLRNIFILGIPQTYVP